MMNVTTRGLRACCLVGSVILFVFCYAGGARFGRAQTTKPREQEPTALQYERTIELFNKVYDAVFPRDSTGEYYLALRYIPSFEPESQILISRTVEGPYEFEYYFLPKGSKRVGQQILELQAKLNSDAPEEIARYIPVEHRRVQLPPHVVSKLMNSYSGLRLPSQLDPRIIVDATRYEFWFVTLSARHQLHVAVNDADYGQQAAYPLVRWMNRVRRAVEAASPSN